ncbi:Uma2 family endonuclease [Microbacterium sp. ARD31]|uniref:Uma2 family endonuclease n=1 Tax=Microbacterium sp. ARD31 TaxID=2962576 RepID=UPI0028828649|nr:Uma2 family endonuclease [Microbacterium sp. ARD31]MDT0185306.1 Uma2 family endonuclease [Microbacterium sp. ARD31]
MTVLPQSRPLTADDLAAIPDDGHRYELIDGTLIVTPAPSWRHQRAVSRLLRALMDAAADDLEVLAAPFDVRLADDTVLQPDVLVCRVTDLTQRNLPAAPLLAVEVLSPSTRLVDLNLKRARYEAAGCPSYWVVDPEAPTITAWELRDGVYAEVASVAGGEPFAAARPFPVTFAPRDLVD